MEGTRNVTASGHSADGNTDNVASASPYRATSLASNYVRTAQLHLEKIQSTQRALRVQQEALRIASNSLDLHVLDIQDAFDTVAFGAERELQRQDSLLKGLDADLQIVTRVPVHKDFVVSSTARRAIEMGERGRTLGDYVSQEKMRTVEITCQRTHGERLISCNP